METENSSYLSENVQEKFEAFLGCYILDMTSCKHCLLAKNGLLKFNQLNNLWKDLLHAQVYCMQNRLCLQKVHHL